ncbi:hypothetical protein [Myxococcus sp. SDU36]|uniref:hypothetical protein n=1 Tax=Myxococcus sp. SDU36 TaxID=2831967 RepID=UPI0025428181|nr:hypothetical protein [Myxococcus sp. SDU36]
MDGRPIVWASRAMDVPLPERIAGSDLILPLMKRPPTKKQAPVAAACQRPVLSPHCRHGLRRSKAGPSCHPRRHRRASGGGRGGDHRWDALCASASDGRALLFGEQAHRRAGRALSTGTRRA